MITEGYEPRYKYSTWEVGVHLDYFIWIDEDLVVFEETKNNFSVIDLKRNINGIDMDIVRPGNAPQKHKEFFLSYLDR